MFQSKEHLIRTSDPSLWGFAGLDFTDHDYNQKLTTRLWNALNSKLFNALIVVLVLIDIFLIVSQILIDSNWIQEPMWQSLTNCTNITANPNTTESNSTLQLSPTLLRTKHIFTYISLTIISFFFIEVLLRIYSGKSKLFVQPFDLLDALVVNIVFILSLVFYFHTSDDKPEGKQSTALIALRLWRVFKVIQLLVEESQQKILQTLSVCEKEKTHSEHKIDILILKVEDLEHEVAYLKEKLKKTEKDNSAYVQRLIDAKPKKANAKRTQSSQSYCPCRTDSFESTAKPQSQITVKPQKKLAQINYTLVDIETQPLVPKPLINDINEINENVLDLDIFAKNLAKSITTDVINTVIDKTNCHSINDYIMGTKYNGIKSQSNKLSISPSSPQSCHSQLITDSVTKPLIFNDKHIYSGLYLISDESLRSQHPNQSQIRANQWTSAAHHLNDESDIERIRKVEFDVNDRDIPLSSL